MQYNLYPNMFQNTNSSQGGFVSVRSIAEAFNWPVAPGNSITFKDENAPYVYTKTRGFSPLEQPVFEKYRLVKEEEPSIANTEPLNYEKQINMLWSEINALKTKIKGVHDESNDVNAVQTVYEQPRTGNGKDGNT